jgi:putative membrane protein
MINFVMDIIRGILIGIANVIPGVSGGTMAVSLGIYDKLISSLTGIFKNFKKSIQFLVPVILGAGIGIVGFAFMIEWLFEKYPLATSLTFVGLILGGIPILVKSLKGDLTKNRKKIGIGHIIAFILLFAFAIIMSMLSGGDTGVVLDKLNVGTICILFLIGMVASATMVIPGVSGSMVLMILGYYTAIITAITDFLSALKVMDMPALLHGFGILFPFGIGIIVGIFVIAKVIEFLFKRFCSMTYSAILGLIIASPFAIFISMGGISIKPLELIIGILLLAVGGIVTYRLGESEK